MPYVRKEGEFRVEDDAKEFCFLHDGNWCTIEEKLRIWV